MAHEPHQRRPPRFDYAATVDPAMSAFGWRHIVLSYLAVLLPLLGIALPRDGDTHLAIVFAVVGVAVVTLTVNAMFLRRMFGTGGWAEPPGVVVLGEAVVVTVSTGALNYALSGVGGFYRPIILIPTVLVAVIGNRAMVATTAAVALATLTVSTWAQGTDPAHLPAFVLSYGSTWGLLVVMVRLLSASALQATAHTQGIADAAAIAARTDGLDEGLARLLPVIGAWAVADRVTAYSLVEGGTSLLDHWPRSAEPGPPPATGLVDRARADEGAAVDGTLAVILADRSDGPGAADLAVAVVVEGAARTRFDGLTYHYQLTRMAAQTTNLVRRAQHIEHLEWLGSTDGLTGLPHRRALEERLDLERTAPRSTGPLTLVMIDLDDFKAYNDTNGHPAGDVLLTRFADALRASVRSTDFVARYGGEEFCVLLPGTTGPEADARIDQLRDHLRSGALDEKVPFSAGIATWDGHEHTEDLLSRADRALYAAKRAGKDQSLVDTSTTLPSLPEDPSRS